MNGPRPEPQAASLGGAPGDGDTAPPHQINHQHDHVAGGGQGSTSCPVHNIQGRGGRSLTKCGRSLKQRPGGRLGPGRREGQLLVPPRRRCSRVPYWSSCLPSPLAHPVLEGAWLQK